MNRHNLQARPKIRFKPLGGVGIGVIALILFCAGGGVTASAALGSSTELASDQIKGAGITPHIGAQIDLDLEFADSSGRTVRLRDYFNGERPVALTLNYYECPSLCVLQLQGLVDTLKAMEWTAGGPFDVLTVSINPKELPPFAAEKKASYIEGYGRPEAAAGWGFLTGKEPAIKSLSETVGFGFVKDLETGEYIHDSAVFICSPDGRVESMLHGIKYDPANFKMALLKAGGGKVGSWGENLSAMFHRHDPRSGQYIFQSKRLMQMLASILAVAAVLVATLLWAVEIKRGKAAATLETRS